MARGLSGKALSRLGNTNGAVPLMYSVTTAAPTTVATTYVLCAAAEFPMRVIGAWNVQNAAGDTGNTFQVFNGSNAISDAVDVSAKGDKDLTWVGELDDAYSLIAEGESLKVGVDDDANCTVYVLCVRDDS